MRLHILAFLILPVSLIAGQPSTIIGNLKSASDGEIAFSLDKPYPDPETTALKQVFKLNQDFKCSFDLEKSSFLNVSIADQSFQLYLEPGSELTLVIEGNPMAPSFSGTLAETNKLLLDFNSEFKNDYSPSAIEEAIEKAPSIDEFEASLFDQRLKQMRFLKERSGKVEISQGFLEIMRNRVSYNYFGQLLHFAILKSGDPTGMKAMKLPDIMLGEMASLPLSDERNMVGAAYRSFLTNYIRYRTSEINGFVKFYDYSDMLEREYSYALRSLSGEPFNYWLGTELYGYCDKSTPETVQKLYKALSQSDLSGNYHKPVYSKCEQEITTKVVKKEEPKEKEPKSKEPTAKKSDQPFTIIDLKGNKVHLDDFRGKVIYVDFWASWCGPCRQQFPYAKELKQMLSPDQQKSVVFLYISIDDTEEKWKKAIEQYGIEGFHTNSPGGWGSSATRHFGVSSIPRYMLIDKKGNIADSNAKRPSSGQEILSDILMLLKQ